VSTVGDSANDVNLVQGHEIMAVLAKNANVRWSGPVWRWVRSAQWNHVERGRTVWRRRQDDLCSVQTPRRAGTQGRAQPLMVSNLIYGKAHGYIVTMRNPSDWDSESR